MRRLTRHPVLLGLALAATAWFGAFGLATGAALTLPYLGIVVALGALVLHLDRSVRFSPVVAVGLTAWAVAHLAGGLVELGGDRVLYNAVLLPYVRYDNAVHFVGFGVAGIAAWEVFLTRAGLVRVGSAAPCSARAAALMVWLLGMGIGALNEVVEFAISQIVEESNIGGYLNTGRDLVANLLGAALAGLWVARSARPAAPAA